MKNILLCTLGASWAVIPEAYAFLAPDRLPLYQNHPKNRQFLALKNEYGLQAPDEIWVCTTQGEQTQSSLMQLQAWIRLCPHAPILKIWQAEKTDQLASQEECGLIRELIVRACLKAHQEATDKGQVVLSLAGGRKTMSADMQWAGSLFGCRALLHVISADKLPDSLRYPEPKSLTQALGGYDVNLITPLIAGQTTRSDLLDIRMNDVGPIVDSADYPLPEAEQPALFHSPENSLTAELLEREKASSSLFGNFLLEISQNESHENWRSLYRLPPRRIAELRETRLDGRHKDWLISLPKADLHRHLGGCLDLAAQQKVAKAIWAKLNTRQRIDALAVCRPLLYAAEWPWDWPEQLKTQNTRSHNCAALLLYAGKQQLLYNLWQITEPRLGLKKSHPHGFSAYERPGELSGSALLSHPAGISAYAQAIVEQAVAEGLAYVELRGSPQKYQSDGLAFLALLEHSLNAILASLPSLTKPLFRFIIIHDRRNGASLEKTIAMAVAAKQKLPDFVVGLDMAGDEQRGDPELIANLFRPAFEQCLPITIHAGEGENAESIWKAAYHLHADRIGHGLTLTDNDKLAGRFRDRAICLELCPSSNREVVGYADPRYPLSSSYPAYPLLQLWKKGLPLTICTDNPGISRTSLAEEYLAAAAMTGYQLTQWEVLAMIKQGFAHGFLPSAAREQLLKKIDGQLYQLIGASS